MSELYPTLYLQSKDDKKGIDAQNFYHFCVLKNLDEYKTADQLKQLLEREDVNTICQDELNKFRGVVSKVGVKETRGIYHRLHDVRDFL